jgi:hypothetical protein
VTVGARNADTRRARTRLLDWRVMTAHILPNCIAPLIVQMAIAAPDVIPVEATLSLAWASGCRPNLGQEPAPAQTYLT